MNVLPELAAANPFAASRVRPGALPYHFPAGGDVQSVLEGLREAGGWGQIIGPHGTGKSTLLAALLPALEKAGRRPVLVTLHDRQRRLPGARGLLRSLAAETVVVIDGYEQLGRLHRLRVKRACRRAGCGLLVTAHRPAGLATVWQTEPDVDLAWRLVCDLLASRPSAIERRDVERCFQRAGGNLRETFFALYDLHERRNRARDAN